LTPTQRRIEVLVMDQRLHDFIREPICLKRTAAAAARTRFPAIPGFAR